MASHPIEREFGRFRDYLLLLARQQVPAIAAGTFDLSGVVQQTLAEAWRHWKTLQEDGAGARRAWLRTALCNNLTDELRRIKAEKRDFRKERSLADALDLSARRLESWLVAEESTPSGRAVKDEDLLRLAAGLARLSDDQRQTVELHHLQGCSLGEIADRLQRSKESVAGLLYRGMKNLRAALKEAQ